MTNGTVAAMPPIARTTAAAACTQALRDAILAGTFAPGSRLPPERTLAVDFGVNRVTVRAALSTLAAERLVTIRQGSGAHVADFRDVGGLEVLPHWLALARAEAGRFEDAHAAIADLLAVRRALAAVLLPKLRHIDDAAIARIEAAVQAFAAVVGERPLPTTERIAQADLAVLRAVLAEAGSPVLAMCFNPIAAVLNGLPELRDAMFASPDENVLGWFGLVAALRTRGAGAGADGGVDVAAVLGDVLARRDAATLEIIKKRRRR